MLQWGRTGSKCAWGPSSWDEVEGPKPGYLLEDLEAVTQRKEEH
jgi:hypothetical protein